MKSFEFFALCILAALLVADGKMYSAVECPNQKWVVDYSDLHQATEQFQNWLFAWQNQCLVHQNHNKPPSIAPAPINGMGSSINYAVKNLITAIELGKIYRPDDNIGERNTPAVWQWADHDNNNCSLQMRCFDCFTLPISVCGYRKYDNTTALPYLARISDNYAHFSTLSLLDVCSLCQAVRKPIQWVLAQYMHYLFRGYKEDVQVEINDRMRTVFGPRFTATKSHFFDHTAWRNVTTTSTVAAAGAAATPAAVNTNSKPVKTITTTIGVHVRGGDPYDGRKVFNVSAYMREVDILVANLSAAGTPVRTVYLCSHTQEVNVVNTEHMHAQYPNRTYNFVVLPHASLGLGEAENALQDNSQTNKPPNHALVMEFYADLEILATVDYFIGSMSNIYSLVAGLRIARGYHTSENRTCLLGPEMVLHCEGSRYAQDFMWRGYHGGLNNPNNSLNYFEPPVGSTPLAYF